MFTDNDANRLQGAVLNPLACQYPFVNQLLTDKGDIKGRNWKWWLVGLVTIVNMAWLVWHQLWIWFSWFGINYEYGVVGWSVKNPRRLRCRLWQRRIKYIPPVYNVRSVMNSKHTEWCCAHLKHKNFHFLNNTTFTFSTRPKHGS